MSANLSLLCFLFRISELLGREALCHLAILIEEVHLGCWFRHHSHVELLPHLLMKCMNKNKSINDVNLNSRWKNNNFAHVYIIKTKIVQLLPFARFLWYVSWVFLLHSQSISPHHPHPIQELKRHWDLYTDRKAFSLFLLGELLDIFFLSQDLSRHQSALHIFKKFTLWQIENTSIILIEGPARTFFWSLMACFSSFFFRWFSYSSTVSRATRWSPPVNILVTSCCLVRPDDLRTSVIEVEVDRWWSFKLGLKWLFHSWCHTITYLMFQAQLRDLRDTLVMSTLFVMLYLDKQQQIDLSCTLRIADWRIYRWAAVLQRLLPALPSRPCLQGKAQWHSRSHTRYPVEMQRLSIAWYVKLYCDVN